MAKHTLKWFENRIGKFLSIGEINIFNQPIEIASKSHAKALWLVQKEKGYRYTELINNA